MHIFAYPAYTSDTTEFLTDLRKQDPKLKQRQIEGRALLWDQDIDLKTKADVEADTLRQQAYVYQTKASV